MPERPNILLLMTDQQRGDCLGIEGHPVLQTPNMDYLARSGTYFRRAYSEAPSCIPARRVLMSGQAPDANGMVGFQNGIEWEPTATLAGELTRAGYQTEMIGKLHLWPMRKRYGFEHMHLADNNRGLNNDWLDWLGGAVPIEQWGMAHGATPAGWIGRPTHLDETQTHSFWCVTNAIEWLSKRDPSTPFFLNLSFIDPHPPMTPPPFYFEQYATQSLRPPVIGDWAEQIDAPILGLDPALKEPAGGLLKNRADLRITDQAMHHCMAGYFGLISHADMQIGRLLQYMRDKQLFDNTLIVFTSDHGEMLGDHNMFAKTRPFEASARIPMLIRPPKSMELPQNQETFSPVGLQDIMPTLLDVAGAPIPDAVTGRSLRSLMAGDSSSWRPWLHGEHAGQYHYDDGMHYATDGHTKYIWYSQTGRELMFDIDEDPNELVDLSHSQQHKSQLETWRQRLIERLGDRPEGFVHDDLLVPGRPHEDLVPGRNVSTLSPR